MSMKAARLFLDGDGESKKGVEVIDFEPSVPSPGHVLLHPQYCGICGTDMTLYHAPRSSLCPHGLFGHEFSAIVADANGSTKFSNGDRVVCNPVNSCYKSRCLQCSSNHCNVCLDLTITGVDTPAELGAGASQSCVAAEVQLFKVPDGMDLKLASLTEPTAVIVHAVRLAGVKEGSRPLILGAGTLGLLCIPVCKFFGATALTILAKHPHQREMAARMAKLCGNMDIQVLSPDLENFKDIRNKEMVIETIGHATDIVKDIMAHLIPRTRFVLTGVTLGPWEIDGYHTIWRELEVIGSFCYCHTGNDDQGHDFDLALKVLQKHPESCGTVQNYEIPLYDVQKGFDALNDKNSSQATKVTIKVN
jgi:threonine dehydrogenase-like Zn-dependent dehydrogenase